MSAEQSQVNSDETILEPHYALAVLAKIAHHMKMEEQKASAASISLDEIRNRAIFLINRQTPEAGLNQQGLPDPHIDVTGSKIDLIEVIAEEATAAIDAIINNAEKFVIAEGLGEEGT